MNDSLSNKVLVIVFVVVRVAAVPANRSAKYLLYIHKTYTFIYRSAIDYINIGIVLNDNKTMSRRQPIK